MSKYWNLIFCLLLLILCFLCFIQIGTTFSFVGGGRSSIETKLEHNYSFYNQNIISLLTTISIGSLGLFFLIRFIKKETTMLTWKHTTFFFPCALVFLIQAILNHNKTLFKFHYNYFIALGLTLILILFFIFFILKKTSPSAFEEVLDHAPE